MRAIASTAIGFGQVFLIILSVSGARAEGTNGVARPIEELFRTEVVYAEEKGEFQLELAPIYQHVVDGDTLIWPLSVEYGLTAEWQVEAEWNAFVQQFPKDGPQTSGIGDLELGTKYSFMNVGGSRFHIAPPFSMELPLGDVNRNLSEGFVEYELSLILARDFPRLHNAQLFTQVGVNFLQRVKTPADPDEKEPAADELNEGAGFFVPFSRGAITMEFNWNNNRWNHHGTENQMYLTPGLLWKLPGKMEVGVGTSAGLNENSDHFDIITHLVVEF